MNLVLENVITRRSVRSFKIDSIEREVLEQIVSAGVYAPSGMNLQTRRFTVVCDRDIISKIAETIKKVDNLDSTYNLYCPPVFIMVSDEKENANSLANCACALENMMLVANSFEIGSVWINQLKTICDVSLVREQLNALNIPSDHVVYGALALGYSNEPTKENSKPLNVVEWF